MLCISVYLSNLIFALLFNKNLQTLSDDIATDLIIAKRHHRPVEYATSVSPYRVCKEFVAGQSFIALTRVFSTAIIVLFIYMSLEFSKPLSTYWKEVLEEKRSQSEDDQQQQPQSSEPGDSRRPSQIGQLVTAD